MANAGIDVSNSIIDAEIKAYEDTIEWVHDKYYVDHEPLFGLFVPPEQAEMTKAFRNIDYAMSADRFLIVGGDTNIIGKLADDWLWLKNKVVFNGKGMKWSQIDAMELNWYKIHDLKFRFEMWNSLSKPIPRSV